LEELSYCIKILFILNKSPSQVLYFTFAFNP
jgi:hypothetical protein